MSLFSAISVSATGMSVQRTRAEVLTQNLANADTTRTQEGGPYKRRDVVFESVDSGASFGSLLDEAGSGLTTVKVSEIRVDQEEGPKRYMPGHPDANADGYVAMPRINPAEDMVDLMGSSRGYQANVAAISAVKDMIQRSIDLFR